MELAAQQRTNAKEKKRFFIPIDDDLVFVSVFFHYEDEFVRQG